MLSGMHISTLRTYKLLSAMLSGWGEFSVKWAGLPHTFLHLDLQGVFELGPLYVCNFHFHQTM